MNGFNGICNCDCLVWILLLMLCCGGCGTMTNNCGCIIPILLVLLCCGNNCGGCHPKC